MTTRKEDQDPVFVELTSWTLEDHTMPAGWYFWEEDWVHVSGPFDTEDRARRELRIYMGVLSATS